MTSSIATISKNVSGGDELVVVKRRDFSAFEKWQAGINDALAKVKRGRAEFRARKTVAVSSPRKFR